MITVFLVLGVILLAVPVTVGIFLIYSRIKQKKGTDILKNAVATRTMMQQGPNGRTIFRTSTVRSVTQDESQQNPVTQSPMLPYNSQEAHRVPRHKSSKVSWQRISRPFSGMPQPQFEDDQIELAQKSQPPLSWTNVEQPAKAPYEGPISPLTPNEIQGPIHSSSWKTIETPGKNPISPLSDTSMYCHSSVTSQVLQHYGYPNVAYPQKRQGDDQQSADSLSGSVLTSLTEKQVASVNPQLHIRTLGLGTARGFVPAHEGIGSNGNGEEFGRIKENMVDANRQKFKRVQLCEPPKAKIARGIGSLHADWV